MTTTTTSVTTPLAIVTSGLLIAAALGLHLVVDRYASGGLTVVDGRDAMFRVNVRSGVVDLCIIEPEPASARDYLANRYAVRCQDPPPPAKPK